MARTRYLKQDFFQDEDLCELSPFHRLCYAGLWTEADKAGRLEDRPKRLKARIFPYDAVDMEDLLTGLARGGFIVRYIADGKTYIAIKDHAWQKHQRPRNDEPDSVIPPADGATAVYASLGDNEGIGVALRLEQAAVQGDTPTVTDPSLPSDEGVTSQRILMGIGMGNGDRNGNGEGAEALTRSTPPSADLPLLVFPTIGTGGSEWGLRRRQVDEWQGLYPSLDILAEAQQALAWVRANPGRRKTVRGMSAFLVNWFNGSVRRGRATGPAASADGAQVSKLTRALQKAGQW